MVKQNLPNQITNLIFCTGLKPVVSICRSYGTLFQKKR